MVSDKCVLTAAHCVIKPDHWVEYANDDDDLSKFKYLNWSKFDWSGLGEGVQNGDAYNGMKLPGTSEVKRGTPLGHLRVMDLPDGHAGFDPQVSHDWNSSRKYRKKFTVQFGDGKGQDYTGTAIVHPYNFEFSSEEIVGGGVAEIARRVVCGIQNGKSALCHPRHMCISMILS